MKRIFSLLKFILPIISILLLGSCGDNKNQTNSNLYWEGNNLYVDMAYPTSSMVSLGKIEWKTSPLDVLEDIYKELKETKRSGEVAIKVRFENNTTDKYGNVIEGYNEYQIATIPISEAKKYRDSKHLDNYYKITTNIYKAANGDFDTVPAIYIDQGFDIDYHTNQQEYPSAIISVQPGTEDSIPGYIDNID